MQEIKFELDRYVSGDIFFDKMEILYVLSGSVSVHLAGRDVTLVPEDLMVFNPVEYRLITPEEGTHTLSALISLPVLQQAEISKIFCCSPLQREKYEHLQLIRGQLAVLFRYCSATESIQTGLILGQLFVLLGTLNQQCAAKEDTSEGMIDSHEMQRALMYIGEHYTENLSLRDVCEYAGVSQSHLSRSFKKYFGISYSDYLRERRLEYAAHLLKATKQSVTDVGLAAGFDNINTFISNFRKLYGVTPRAYRYQFPEESAEAMTSNLSLSYMSLLKYARFEDQRIKPVNPQLEQVQVRIDIRQTKGNLTLCHNDAISIGWAQSLLMEHSRSAVKDAVNRIGFRYIYMRGTLDDSIGIYREDSDGNPVLNFTYLDMILDFVLEIGARPWMELGHTPGTLTGRQDYRDNSYQNISLPVDLSKWQQLTEGLISHLIERYGKDACMTWRFSPSAVLFAEYGEFTLEKYLPYYLRTYKTLKAQLPAAKWIGCRFDLDLIAQKGTAHFEEFLCFCDRNACLPDVLSFQCYQSDFSKGQMDEISHRIASGVGVQKDLPVKVSINENVLKDEIEIISKLLRLHRVNRPIALTGFNSTMWQGELGNDTCFKSAWLFKAFIENTAAFDSMVYSYLTDNTDRTLQNASLFHGGYGLMTYNGVPKASYYAYVLMNQLSGELLAQGNGYVITKSKDSSTIKIGLYHYAHYRPETMLEHALPPSEQRTWDRYYSFEDKGVRNYYFLFQGMPEGTYDQDMVEVTRNRGSSYDIWMAMGAPDPQNSHIEYLKKVCEAGYTYRRVRVSKKGELMVSAVLNIHEIMIITIKKDKTA